MILNLGSLAFNANIATGGGTPAWGTELGQGEGYKFAFEDMSDFFTGMVYNSVADLENVYCPLGKGGNQRADYDFVIASVFDKVFVNGKPVQGGRFLLLVVKKINGEHHVGRRTIKYNPRMTYHGEYINEDCYRKITRTMGLPEDAAWFAYELNIKNQDELHFVAYELGKEPQQYRDNDERKNAFVGRLHKEDKHLFTSTKHHLQDLQQIFYGAPGTGKSHGVKYDEGVMQADKRGLVFRTTFHPDSDYSTFVGAYKPTTVEVPMRDVTGKVIMENGTAVTENRIVYEFVAQTFLQAYTEAWKRYASDTMGGKEPERVYLVIEEINRGNCAQIFGDLFQLLDRNDEGFSDYPINADKDLQRHLSKVFENMAYLRAPEVCGMSAEEAAKKIRKGEILLLPNNLYIWATMNTSDQSLFPIDSAFKRRWEWHYVKIKNHPEQGYRIRLGDEEQDWWAFLQQINAVIASTTASADKQLGYFFCKAKGGIVGAETFVGKVLFYLWNDVFKDYGFEDTALFTYTDSKGHQRDLTFPDFYDDEGAQVNLERVKDFVARVMSWQQKEDKAE